MNQNPFSKQDTDRHNLWNMLVYRDIQAFIREDWSLIADDFIDGGFIGIDAGNVGNPDAWRMTFPTLNSYRDEWLRQASVFNGTEWNEEVEAALFRVTVLRDIELKGDVALAHKKFFGNISKKDGSLLDMNWQTLYYCRKIDNSWKISGFVGYMPHIWVRDKRGKELKRIPENASQHKTAGPYSPVLVVNSGEIVVLSGQAAIDKDGNVIGRNIEEQTVHTMSNCLTQLRSAGCGFEDVFKVNVYLRDLNDWSRFNAVYNEYFAEVLPVRTTVQSDLLMNLLIEIEMWAVTS